MKQCVLENQQTKNKSNRLGFSHKLSYLIREQYSNPPCAAYTSLKSAKHCNNQYKQRANQQPKHWQQKMNHQKTGKRTSTQTQKTNREGSRATNMTHATKPYIQKT